VYNKGAGVAQSVQSLTTDSMIGDRFPAEAKDFSSSLLSRPDQRLIQPSTSGYRG
jgi:hypothetical protein